MRISDISVKKKSAAVIEDLHEVTRYAKEQYGADVPYFLFGHSMGSFMARRYLMTYGEELTGAIICGTGYTPGAVLTAGKLCAGVISKVKRRTSPLEVFAEAGLWQLQQTHRR